MKIREWMIRRLGGFTLEDVQAEKKRMTRARPALKLPVRLICRQILRRAEDARDSLVRENMAYRLAGEMLRANAIRFTLDQDEGSGLPALIAEAWVEAKD